MKENVVCKVWEGDGTPRPPTHQMDGENKATKKKDILWVLILRGGMYTSLHSNARDRPVKIDSKSVPPVRLNSKGWYIYQVAVRS